MRVGARLSWGTGPTLLHLYDMGGQITLDSRNAFVTETPNECQTAVGGKKPQKFPAEGQCADLNSLSNAAKKWSSRHKAKPKDRLERDTAIRVGLETRYLLERCVAAAGTTSSSSYGPVYSERAGTADLCAGRGLRPQLGCRLLRLPA